ncbi:MAG: GLUG motif-containing protein, partial [Ignavibacteriaceae bacterium]|nr:GLUG motif-containing protein [Ignavibacteriaceae bacterium]
VMLFGQTAITPAVGDGTIENPYQIASLENLYWISQYSTEWSKYYIQTADIDASATSGWSGGGWTPIGSGATPYFSGSYNGQGHTISGLYILRSVQFQGLFGKTSGATIQNLGVTAVNVQAPSYIGGLIGACNFSTVSNCYSTGRTRADGSHTNTKLGGLIGIVEGSSTVSNCYSTANVQTSYKENGGFAGEINNATVSNCYSKGLVTGTGGGNGGFVGTVTSATVTNCFWDTQTSGKISSAAGTGKTTAQMKDYTTFTGWDFIIETANGSNNFWDMDQLVTVNNGYPILTWQTGADNILAYSGGLGTSGDPYQIFTLSDLSSLTQRSIDWNKYYSQEAEINALSTQYWDDADDNSDGDKYNDPNDATNTGNNEGFSPIGTGSTHFTGSFNGQGFAIDGLYINRATSYIGLFGSASAATIQNLGVTNINFTGTGNVGGIAGYTLTSGTISNCYATGTIAADNDHIGGLVGYNWKANISRCYANVAVTVSGSRNYTGGLVGINTEATIQDCYSRGAVDGNNYVGGLVGSHTISSLIDKCYSIATVTGTSNTGGIVGYNNSTVT